MSELAGILTAFHEATLCPASVWEATNDVEDRERGAIRAVAVSSPDASDLPQTAFGSGVQTVGADKHQILIAPIPGPRGAWLAVGPRDAGDGQTPATLAKCLNFLLPVVSRHRQSALEVEHAANELAERYEEINLLYTISEILGRTVALEEVARTILTEISETVGARRASILVYDSATAMLQVVASLGGDGRAADVAVGDETSVAANVFRSRHPMMVEPDQLAGSSEAVFHRGGLLSVPIMWTAPDGSDPLGVVNLSDRRSAMPFSAGDQKLVAAIATQIGTAIQNSRLVRASMEQQRLAHEMGLAHDLQMRLLPNPRALAPDVHVAARVVPAESVGGDFYNLFRLGKGRTGIMIGDVSSHGYRAALIMALTMSASAIHARTTSVPGKMMSALLDSLGDELGTTEMFISVFYAVLDSRAGVLRYANAGHPHAFVLDAAGNAERLAALDPPLGMAPAAAGGAERAWRTGEDLLVLFTDGISDSRDANDVRLGEEAVLDVIRAHRSSAPNDIVERVFERVERHGGVVASRDDLTLVVLRD